MNNNNAFLPSNYEVPQTGGNYMKFKKGDNEFRVLSSAIVGFEYWTSDNKPVRMKEMPEVAPHDMRDDSKIKAFWAFVCWNYQDKQVQILEITQVSIMNAIKKLVDSPKWGDPKQYDINVIREGDGFETKYQVQPSPPSDLPMEAANAFVEQDINLEALFSGDDPFQGKAGKVEEEINVKDINL